MERKNRCYLTQASYGLFDNYIWGFTNEEVIYESYDTRTTSPLSDRISEELEKRKMKFVGSTVIYSYLQAIGIIRGHGLECDCFDGTQPRNTQE